MGNAARLGLKLSRGCYISCFKDCRNGECSPTGIETRDSYPSTKSMAGVVEMGNAARLGLKLDRTSFKRGDLGIVEMGNAARLGLKP